MLLPARNKKDFDDIPEEARQQLEFIWLDRVDEAAAAALETGAQEGAAQPEPSAASEIAEAGTLGGIYTRWPP